MTQAQRKQESIQNHIKRNRNAGTEKALINTKKRS